MDTQTDGADGLCCGGVTGKNCSCLGLLCPGLTSLVAAVAAAAVATLFQRLRYFTLVKLVDYGAWLARIVIHR